MHDVIIVGAGPAGITAAVYCARKQLNVLVLSENIGGQAGLSGSIENYIGFQLVSGPQLAEKFDEHLKQFDVEVLSGKAHVAQSVEKQGDFFQVSTLSAVHGAKCVILACGATPRKLGIPGEEKYSYRGVTQCATCDAPLFKGKTVAVIGGGNSALDAILQLNPIASKIYALVLGNEFNGDKIMLEKVLGSDKVEAIFGVEVKEFVGNAFLEGVKISAKVPGGAIEERLLDVQGAFVEIGWVPNSGVAGPKVAKNRSGEIIVNRHCETSVPGLFAAGDVTDVPYKQIIIASGQGSVAALSAFDYLSRQK